MNHPNVTVPRSRSARLSVSVAAAAALGALALAAAFAAEPRTPATPIVGIHYQDLEPEASGEVTIAVANPGLSGDLHVSAAASTACLEIGEPFNTRYEVWRVPARLVGAGPCHAVVTVAATGPGDTWRGAVLVALRPLVGLAPLSPASGVTLSHASASPWREASEDGSGTSHATTLHELTFENGAGAPLTLLALGEEEAFGRLFGAPLERRQSEQGVTYWSSRAADGRPIAVLRPGSSASFAFPTDANALLASGPSAVTIGVLPIVRLGGESHYLPGLLTSYFGPRTAP